MKKLFERKYRIQLVGGSGNSGYVPQYSYIWLPFWRKLSTYGSGFATIEGAEILIETNIRINQQRKNNA